MARRFSRRTVLLTAGAVALRARAAPAVPGSFDHLQVGCGDLDQGIDFVERRLGVRAAMGGVHPGRGSRNALLSFGKRQYLEIIAPDPAQPRSNDARQLYKIEAPRLIGWAAHVDDMDALARHLTAAKIAFDPPRPGSRKRPSGELIRWKLLFLRDDQGGLLPFFIEWDKESPHPASDAPGGCRLEGLQLKTPQPDALRATVSTLKVDVTVSRAPQPAIQATLTGPKGTLSLPA